MPSAHADTVEQTQPTGRKTNDAHDGAGTRAKSGGGGGGDGGSGGGLGDVDGCGLGDGDGGCGGPPLATCWPLHDAPGVAAVVAGAPGAPSSAATELGARSEDARAGMRPADSPRDPARRRGAHQPAIATGALRRLCGVSVSTRRALARSIARCVSRPRASRALPTRPPSVPMPGPEPFLVRTSAPPAWYAA